MSASPNYSRRPSSPLASFLRPLLFILAVSALGLWWFWPRWQPGLDPNAAPRAVTPRGNLAEEEQAMVNLFKKVSPSVVHITTLARQPGLFSLDVQEIPQGTGSGFVWDENGHVVTNFHVIQGASAAEVVLADQSKPYGAQLVGAAPDRDLAVLKIDAPKNKLRPIDIGTSHDLQVGQKAFAIGNPFGLDQTLTTGIVSALGREIQSMTRRKIRDAIQTDAAINPGNSGGPLLDSSGRLIGVNTQIYSPSGASSGIGFAIPVDEVNRVVPEIIRHGKVTRPILGISPASDQLLRRYKIEGALIQSLSPGGPAAKAGLLPTRPGTLGDLIVAIDGKAIKSMDDLYAVLELHKAGDTVTVTILRDEEKLNVEVTLGAPNQ